MKAYIAEGNDDKESIDGSLEPPVYMLISLVKLIIVVLRLQ